jgi:hypothetical protein
VIDPAGAFELAALFRGSRQRGSERLPTADEYGPPVVDEPELGIGRSSLKQFRVNVMVPFPKPPQATD